MIVILSCYFLIEKSITPCDVKLFFSFCDCESVMLTKTENRLKPTETDRFPIISVGYGWEFHKPKISVLVGQN